MLAVLKNDDYKWYPVCTFPRAEKSAYKALTNKGLEVYLPLRRQLKQWSDRKKWVDEPLIKSYLFVRMKENQQTEVLMTKGISRFIFFSGKIASMPDHQINDLKIITSNPLELEITAEGLQPGERVVVKAGALKGLSGEIVSFRSQKLLVMRLDSLGYSIIINVAKTLLNRV